MNIRVLSLALLSCAGFAGYAAMLPPPEAPKENALSSEQLTKLLRAQTNALVALNKRVEKLEENIAKFESKEKK